MTTGLKLFQQAELAYHLGKPEDTFRLYQKALKRILKHESVVAKHGLPVPVGGPTVSDSTYDA